MINWNLYHLEDNSKIRWSCILEIHCGGWKGGRNNNMLDNDLG